MPILLLEYGYRISSNNSWCDFYFYVLQKGQLFKGGDYLR